MIVQSPCIGVCCLDEEVCEGCGRTLLEIAQWSTMSNEQRQYVMKRVEERKQENGTFQMG